MSSGGGTSEQTPGSYQQTSNLDTIISSVPPKSSGFRHPNNSPSPTQEDSTGEEGSKKYRASPRSIDMKTDQSNFDWKTQNGGAGDNMTEDPRPATTDPSSGNRHRRSTSGGSPGVGPYGDLHPTQISFGSHGSMVIPPQMMNWPPAAPYSSDGPEGHYQRHRRAGSWSGQYPPASAPPSPRYFSQGNPMVPFLNDQQSRSEMNPLLGGPQTSSIGRSSSSRGKRKSGSGEHRRSFSSGAANPGMHEDFFKPPEGMPPPPPPRQPEQFSPRTEFMKLAGGFQRSPSSPSGRKMSPMPYAPQSPHGTPRASSMRGFSSSNMENTVSFSPHVSVSPHPQSAYGSIDMNNAPTSTQLPDFPSSTGGEAVFLTQKSGQRHRESTRKRHMRQQSAQLFMEDVKGTQQPLACRDIVFLLLFLFHIVGVAFLATTYGNVALDQKSQIEIGEGNVELYYFNLVYVAGMSGFFAVAASLMALGLMTIIARRFVQVALVLAVTISFAWGTIGIGLSPKNIVPITGFIALALSVAYTFIVWDRIPFCAANLVTALSGIKANSGTLVIAICFQIFCFAYCIFYALVVVGVHDAILEDKLHLSSDMQGFVYAMLGISFYWTYHVILVRLLLYLFCFVSWYFFVSFLTAFIWNRILSK